MIHPLVRKELREHLWVLLALWMLCAIGFAATLAAARDGGSPLVAYRLSLLSCGVLLALALVNRLVVREYGGHTQLFLETLPVGRGQVVAIKWLFGAACLLLPMALGFGLTLLAASGKVVLTPSFVVLLALRGLTFLLFCYALAFLVGLTGRYRHVLWLAMLLLAAIAGSVGQLSVEHWPPLQMVSAAMPFQRDGIPVSWFVITWAATLALVGATFLLALGGRGSWVVALSQRMSLREKTIVAASFLGALYLVMQVDERKPKPPFELLDAVHSDEGLPGVSVARVEGLDEADARRLAQHMATDLQQTRDYLALDALPAVAVLPDPSLDPDLFLLAELPDSDGVVVGGAPGAGGFDVHGFRAFTLARVLDWYSRGRAMREQRRWLLDGFTHWQLARDDEARRELLGLRAAVAARVLDTNGTSLADALRNWLATRERLGDCLGEALAWRVTDHLAGVLGDSGFRDFARALFAVRAHQDIRAFLSEQSPETQLRKAGSPGLGALLAQLQAAQVGESAQYAARLAAVSLPVVSITTERMRGAAFELRYQLSADTATAPQPFAVLYTRIGPWEKEVPRAQLARVDAITSGVLPTSFAQGERVLTVVEMPMPQLACTVRLHAHRLDVR